MQISDLLEYLHESADGRLSLRHHVPRYLFAVHFRLNSRVALLLHLLYHAIFPELGGELSEKLYQVSSILLRSDALRGACHPAVDPRDQGGRVEHELVQVFGGPVPVGLAEEAAVGCVGSVCAHFPVIYQA